VREDNILSQSREVWEIREVSSQASSD